MKNRSRYLQVIITVPDRLTAQKITRILLERHVGACVQTIGPITSCYWWKGKIAKSREFLCIVKTNRRSYPVLEKIVKNIHPYEVPEIIAVLITTGYRGYLVWLREALGKPDRRFK